LKSGVDHILANNGEIVGDLANILQAVLSRRPKARAFHLAPEA
jgi:hypothetical protein